MAQFRIEATSEKAGKTVSNIQAPVTLNPEEDNGVEAPVIPFPSPAEFTNKGAADAAAAKFADWLNHEDHEGTWDWVGKSTAA